MSKCVCETSSRRRPTLSSGFSRTFGFQQVLPQQVFLATIRLDVLRLACPRPSSSALPSLGPLRRPNASSRLSCSLSTGAVNRGDEALAGTSCPAVSRAATRARMLAFRFSWRSRAVGESYIV
jgi:hypothetical protein